MIAVKLQCDCGQRYAFEVEPVGGVLPSTVACPACGADGTAAANAFIAEKIAAQPAPAPKPSSGAIRIGGPAQGTVGGGGAVRLSASSTVTAPPVPPAAQGQGGLRVSAAPAQAETPPATPGHRHVDRTRAENEARAKVLWGDDPKDVASFLRSQGLSFEESNGMVQSLIAERAKTVRAEGFKKMIIGGALILLPIVFFLVSLASGRIYVRPLALTVMAGFYGLWQFVKGLLMFIAPKSESGDVFDN